MKNKSIFKILIFVALIILTIFIFLNIKSSSVSAALSSLNQNRKIRVLIVPGHEPHDGGALYKGLKERDLNVQLAELIRDNLSKDTNLEIVMARDTNDWNPDLKQYVETSATEIMNWVAQMKKDMFAKVDAGVVQLIDPGLKLNAAAPNAVLYLFGTNKWIAENNIDVVFHVHFNNNPKINGRPNYRGYAIYVPEKQYANAASSRVFANYLAEEIDKIQYKSNMPQEKDFIIEDQALIAAGAFDTLKIPSVLVEYAYIYEPLMSTVQRRNAFIEKAASSTAEAMERYIKEQLIK